MHDLLNLLNELATKVPLDWLIASGLLSPLLLAVKKWRITKNVETILQKDWVMYSLVILTSAAFAIASYILNDPTKDPTVIAIQTAMTAFMSQPIYFFVVKPLFKLIEAQLAKAAQLNADIKSAAVSPTEPIVAAATPEGMAQTVDIQTFGR